MSEQVLELYNSIHIDIVMCIDATAGMSPCLDELKAKARTFPRRIVEHMEENDWKVTQLRIKLIAFRDYACDEEPMVESAFFTLPEQQDVFESCLNRIEATGGGDCPENALEALALALKSDWTTGGDKRRHIVMLFTDAPALPLGARADCPYYPSGMPKDLPDLSAWWEGTDPTFEGTFQPRNGRLIAFVPNAEPWVDLQVWTRYWPAYFKCNCGLQGINLDDIFF